MEGIEAADSWPIGLRPSNFLASSAQFLLVSIHYVSNEHPRFKEFDTSSLRVAISGAAAMPEELIRKALSAWPKARIYNTYALTEAGTGGAVLNAARR